jgi:predicted nuclease of predicted toxin-antitoxin system
LSLSFLIDAQLPPGLAVLFTRAGHEAVHVADVGLHTEDDAKISAYASKAGMVLVTKDQDFATMRRLSPAAPRVIWVRIGNTTNRVLRERIQPLMGEILAALAAGEEIIEIR